MSIDDDDDDDDEVTGYVYNESPTIMCTASRV